MRLHYATNTISVAVAIALEEAELDYEPIRVDFAQAEQTKPAYLALNPKGRVPTLETDGHFLTETGAILDYIASMAPEKSLVPSDPIAAANMRSILYYLASTMHVNHAHGLRGHRWADQQSSFDDMKQKVPQTMTASTQYIEDTCALAPFALGDEMTLVDPYLFTVCTWLPGDGVDMRKFPKLNAFYDRMNSRATVQKVVARGILKL